MSLRIFQKRSFEEIKNVVSSSIVPTTLISRSSFGEHDIEDNSNHVGNNNNNTSQCEYDKIHDLSNIDQSGFMDDYENEEEHVDDNKSREFEPLLEMSQDDIDFATLSPFRLPVTRGTCTDATKSSCGTTVTASTNTLEEGLLFHGSDEPPLRHRRYCHPNDDDIFRRNIDSTTMINNNNINSKSDCKRILDRDAACFQSRGRWRVQHKSRHTSNKQAIGDDDNIGDGGKHSTCSKSFWDNWFYYLVYQRTIILLMILLSIYVLIICLFALIYYNLSHYGRLMNMTISITDTDSKFDVPTSNQTTTMNSNATDTNKYYCGMDITTPIEAFYFSLSTMATIGYGVSNYFFGDCYIPLFLIFTQVCCSIIFNAIAASILFLRISRGHKRMKTILFSNHATIQYINHIPHFMFRIAELRRYQLFDASIRCYCIKSERYPMSSATTSSTRFDENDDDNNDQGMRSPLLPTRTDSETNSLHTTYYVTKSMKLLHEEVSPQILMSLPQVIVHRMDQLSPLLPSIINTNCSSSLSSTANQWYDEHGYPHRSEYCHYNPSDRCNANCADVSAIDSYEEQGQITQTKHYFEDRNIEIVILLEGTDELTGAVIQARHSYTYNDIVWNHTFAPCVFPCERNMSSSTHNLMSSIDDCRDVEEMRSGGSKKKNRKATKRNSKRSSRAPPVCEIDFSQFHETIPVPHNVESSPYV